MTLETCTWVKASNQSNSDLICTAEETAPLEKFLQHCKDLNVLYLEVIVVIVMLLGENMFFNSGEGISKDSEATRL